jgi:hypothetical protein
MAILKQLIWGTKGYGFRGGGGLIVNPLAEIHCGSRVNSEVTQQ